MAGLASYSRSINAGLTEVIGARGHVIVFMDGPGSVQVVARANNINGQSGQAYKLTLSRFEKWVCPQEFDQVEVTNVGSTNGVFEFLVGDGDFVRIPKISPNIAPTVRTTSYVVSRRTCGLNNISWHQDILPANPLRKRYRYAVFADFANGGNAVIEFFGRNQSPILYTKWTTIGTWAAGIVTTAHDAIPMLPCVFPGYTWTNPLVHFGANPDETTVGGPRPSGISFNAARTEISFTMLSPPGVFRAFYITDRNGVEHEFLSSAATVLSNVYTWPLPGSFAHQNGETVSHQCRIDVSGTFTEHGAPVAAFGSPNAGITVNGGLHYWSDWIDSTDSVSMHWIRQQQKRLAIIFQEETYDA